MLEAFTSSSAQNFFSLEKDHWQEEDIHFEQGKSKNNQNHVNQYA